MSALQRPTVGLSADLKKGRARVDGKTLGFMLLECLVAWGTVALAAYVWNPAVVIVAMLVVATRQHALFILFHDAVHYLVARDRRLNDAITNTLIGVPQLVPVQLYRRLHLAHHARLGTDADPERLLLYRDQPWQYRPLPLGKLARQVLGDLLLLNNLKTLWHFGRELRDPDSKLALPTATTHPEFYLSVLGWSLLLVLGLWQAPDLTARVLFLWLVPLLTLTQAIQKVRSFLEHAAPGAPTGGRLPPGMDTSAGSLGPSPASDAPFPTDVPMGERPSSNMETPMGTHRIAHQTTARSAAGLRPGEQTFLPDPPELTYSWRPGLFGRLIVWPYHISYHREHHLQPKVPWHALPERFRTEAPTPTPWWRILWDGRW